MLPDEKIGCHRLPRRCRDGVVDQHCQLWTNVRGHDPQTGAVIDRWACADAFVPMLLVESAQMSRQTAAAVESFRNEVVKTNAEMLERQREAMENMAGRLRHMQ